MQLIVVPVLPTTPSAKETTSVALRKVNVIPNCITEDQSTNHITLVNSTHVHVKRLVFIELYSPFFCCTRTPASHQTKPHKQLSCHVNGYCSAYCCTHLVHVRGLPAYVSRIQKKGVRAEPTNYCCICTQRARAGRNKHNERLARWCVGYPYSGYSRVHSSRTV